MEVTDFHSNKYLQNANYDPLINIFRQLREIGAQQGDYIKIYDEQSVFQPIYKISYLQQNKPRPSQSINIRKSQSKQPSNNKNSAFYENQEDSEKFRLSFGSQIYLKFTNLLQSKITLLKPFFLNLFVLLQIKGKGFINCTNEKISISSVDKTQSIWMCIKCSSQESDLLNRKEVYFCNFSQNQYLCIDTNGILAICGYQKATRFLLKKYPEGNSFILQGRNPLSMLVRNKSHQQIRKIIDRSLQRSDSSKTDIQVEFQITSVEDTMIAIHLQLNFSRKALQQQPSLKLIKLILSELCYYNVLDFLKNDSILSEHIQQLLLDYGILKLIANFLERFLQDKRNEHEQNMLIINQRTSMIKRQSTFSKASQASMEILLTDVFKKVGLLCRQNIEISKIFFKLVDQLIVSQNYELASYLIQENQYFLSQFHKANWYNLLYRAIFRNNKSQICHLANFLTHFCQSQRDLRMLRSSIVYWNRPSTNNQYLLYHSLKTGDFFSKIFQYQLYVEGSYVFVHDSKSGKDVQFHTFIQGTLNDSSQNIHRKSIKLQNQQSHLENTDGVELILAQLKLLKAFQYNYNINLISNSWGLAYGLIPYCYKENFPQIKHQQIRATILKMFIEIEPCYKYAKLSHPNLIICSLVEGQGDNRKSLDDEPKLGYSNFIKSNKKKAQLSRKLLKQMGTFFLKKIKQWVTALRKKLININQICFDEQINLEQWLEIMIQAVTIRLFKVKQKKEGQLLGYIKKLFETIEQKKGVTQNEGNLMSDLTEFLIQILKIHPKYDHYLQQIKAKRLYDGKKNQINKVINTFQNKKEVKFIRVQKGLTKIQLIDVIHKNSQQQPKIAESSFKQSPSRPKQFEKKLPQLKLLALRLLQLMTLNVNEEMIEEAVDTLAYLTKNPNAIQNLSSFNLLDLMPKYPFEQIIKRVTLEQWYLSSNTLLLNNYIDLLRLIITKKASFRRSLCSTLLIDNQTVFKIFHNISYPLRFLKRAVHRCQTWLRPTLIQKYPDIYQGVDKNLQIILDCLVKIKDTLTDENFSKFIENLGLLNIFVALLQYMQTYYLQYQALPQLNRSRMFHAKNQVVFVETKLTPLTLKIIKNLQLYCLNNHSDQISISIKWTLSIFSQLLVPTKLFQPFISKIAKHSLSLTEQSFLCILKSLPSNVLAHSFKNLNKTWYLFKGYLYLQTREFLRQIHILYQCGIQTMTQIEEIQFLKNFLSSNIDKNHHPSQKEKLQEEIYEFQHQLILLKIVLKLVYNQLWVQLIQWFKDKVFQQLIEQISKTSTQNYYVIQLSSEQIFRRRLIAQLGYHFKEHEQNKKSNNLSIKHQDEEQSETLQIKHTIIDFLIQEHKLSCFYINLDEADSSQYRKLSENTLLQYLQYLVCDIAVLAFSLDFLSVGEISEDIHKYFTKLKDIYKTRVTQKSNEDTYAAFLNVQKMFGGQISARHNYKPRTIKFDKFSTSSQKHSQLALTENKAIRKWIKALKQMQKQTFIKNSELILQILQFDNIYELKNENQEINLVINHKDLFSKLIEISLNLKRLQISPQNQIFILESLLIQVKPKKKNSKQISDQTSNYGFRLLEHLVQIQSPIQSDNVQEQYLKPWRRDVYCVSLMLRIIDFSGCLKAHRARYQYLQAITKLFEKSLRNYQRDLNQLVLYFSTLHSKQQLLAFEIILPFQSILSIILNHYSLKNLERQYLKPIILLLIQATFIIDQHQKDNIARYDINYLHKILGQLDKDIINEACRELEHKKLFFSYLITNYR